MTSERECFVYITLPGETKAVTVGKLVVTEAGSGEIAGQFVYGQSYLARENAVSIDPVTLTLSDKVFETGLMGGLFGAFRDASPDLWGRVLIERFLNRVDLSEFDYLLLSPDDRIGALGFGPSQVPPESAQEFNKHIDLERLQLAADLVADPKAAADSLKSRAGELLLIGTSMGGARPKAVVSDEKALWVAKFSHPSDRFDMAVAEYSMLRLARECGIDASESRIARVGGRKVLLVKRFDRELSGEGYLKHRMISALTALRSDDNPLRRDKWSYILVAEELRRFSGEPVLDARELFRRMVFNSLITNTDDHPRNHAFIATQAWRLAPAYDLTPIPMISAERRDLAMNCGAFGRYANAKNLISECRRFMLEPGEAKEIIQEMASYIAKNWRRIVKEAGMSELDCDTIEPAFLYPGFFT